jgi:hypothetical protein
MRQPVTTTSVDWWPAAPTIHRWRQTLTPPTTAIGSFNGRKVTEQDPGGGGPDTCWFSGSAYAPATAITGGTWIVNSGNIWAHDHVGWTPEAVTYYRQQMRAPCHTRAFLSEWLLTAVPTKFHT